MQLRMENVSYSYTGKEMVLENINYTFEEGKIYAITGKSGAGKTTLLSLLSQLASPTSGKITYDDQDIKSVDQYRYRSHHVGVIFQNFNLLPNLSAVENVELSMEIAGMKGNDKKKQAMELLRSVGLSEEEGNRRVLKLSGGQQQRVAIARALSYDPLILLADEPCGNLDEETGEEIMEILQNLAYEHKLCIIIVTHSPSIAKRCDERYELEPIKHPTTSKIKLEKRTLKE